MNYIEHEFNGHTSRLSMTAGALYDIYERYGYTDSVADALKLEENTAESWDNTCWLYALLASQGELQRRALGYDAEPMIAMEALRRFAAPADIPGVKTAVMAALHMGFTRAVEPSTEREVDLVLKELELDEKKKEVGIAIESFISLLAAAPSGLAQKTRSSSVPENTPI